MESSNPLVSLVRADALRLDSQEAEDDLREGADGPATAVGEGRRGSTARIGVGAAGRYLFAEQPGRKAGADDGVAVRLGVRALQDETESAPATVAPLEQAAGFVESQARVARE